MNGGKKYGLTIPSKAKGKVVARASVFCDDDSDDECEENTAPTQSKAVKKVGSETVLKRKTQLEIDKALAEDPSVYEYDEIYDKIQETKAAKIPGAQKDKEKKPKYIQCLMKTAEQRKKEYERRIEKQVQKEREAEKGQFEDKETFVTAAYRKKMQEIAEEEERERKEAELEAKLDVTRQSDLSGFYRHLLRQTTGEEEIPDVTKVKTEPADDDQTIKQEPAEIDFSADRDASDSDESTSSDSKSSGTRSTSPETMTHINSDRQRYRSRTPNRSKSPHRHGSRTPEKHSSRTPERQRHRSRTPERRKYKSRNWENRHYRSRTPERQRERTRSPEERRHRNSERRRNQSRTPDRYRSRTPDRHRHRSRTPNRHRHRSRTPNRRSKDDREWKDSRKARDRDSDRNKLDTQHKERTSKHRNGSHRKHDRTYTSTSKNGSSPPAQDRIEERGTQKADSSIKTQPGKEESTKAQVWSVKFAKRNVGESVEEARARYLARKQNRVIAIAAEQD